MTESQELAEELGTLHWWMLKVTNVSLISLNAPRGCAQPLVCPLSPCYEKVSQKTRIPISILDKFVPMCPTLNARYWIRAQTL